MKQHARTNLLRAIGRRASHPGSRYRVAFSYEDRRFYIVDTALGTPIQGFTHRKAAGRIRRQLQRTWAHLVWAQGGVA